MLVLVRARMCVRACESGRPGEGTAFNMLCRKNRLVERGHVQAAAIKDKLLPEVQAAFPRPRWRRRPWRSCAWEAELGFIGGDGRCLLWEFVPVPLNRCPP